MNPQSVDGGTRLRKHTCFCTDRRGRQLDLQCVCVRECVWVSVRVGGHLTAR